MHTCGQRVKEQYIGSYYLQTINYIVNDSNKYSTHGVMVVGAACLTC